jgi:glycosyltransferase involved in cell wall biosynthesis
MAHVRPPAFPPRVVGLIGDLFPLKNHLELVELVRRLRNRGLDVEGLLVGRAHTGEKAAIDDYAAAVLAAADDPQSHVRLVSATPERMPDVMAEIDVLCHLSTIPETFGRVCAEAMAAGRPVIAYGHGAVAEIVLAGRTGMLCPPGDLSAVETAFVRMHNDESAFRQMSLDAQAHAVSQYGQGQQGATIADALVELARQSPR